MATRYEVEWIETVPTENGDTLWDRAEYCYTVFTDPVKARAFARQVIVGKPVEVAHVRKQETVTARQLAAAAEDDDCGHWRREGGLIWLDVGEVEEIAA